MNKENNCVYFFLGPIILLACCVCAFGIFGPIVHGKQVDTIINQYEILQQEFISQYNHSLQFSIQKHKKIIFFLKNIKKYYKNG